MQTVDFEEIGDKVRIILSADDLETREFIVEKSEDILMKNWEELRWQWQLIYNNWPGLDVNYPLGDEVVIHKILEFPVEIKIECVPKQNKLCILYYDSISFLDTPCSTRKEALESVKMKWGDLKWKSIDFHSFREEITSKPPKDLFTEDYFKNRLNFFKTNNEFAELQVFLKNNWINITSHVGYDFVRRDIDIYTKEGELISHFHDFELFPHSLDKLIKYVTKYWDRFKLSVQCPFDENFNIYNVEMPIDFWN